MRENNFKEFISVNISYLCDVNKLTQNEFGAIFNLGRSVVSHYVSQKTTPRIDTIIEICNHFNISIDNFLYKDLSILPKSQVNKIIESNESNDCKMCDMYERMLADKDKLILALEREIESLRYPGKDSSQTA